MNTLVIDNLSIGYGRKVVARGLSATIGSGRLTCLIGRNGLGKSTLLRTLAGLQRPLAGGVTLAVDGKRFFPGLTDRRVMARLVSVVLTEKITMSHISVAEFTAMGRMPYTGCFGRLGDEDHRVVAESLRLTGMDGFARRDMSTLSDGERQKVVIARALAQQTPVMLLDEPTAFLDYPAKREVMVLLRHLAHDMQKIVVVSSHDLDIVLHTADALLTMNDKGMEAITQERLQRFLTEL